MLHKIKQILLSKRENLPKDYMSSIDYRPNIKAVRLEIYKDITVVYIQKPSDHRVDPLDRPVFEYNLFFKRRFYSDHDATLDEVIEKAHDDIDTEFINKPQ